MRLIRLTCVNRINRSVGMIVWDLGIGHEGVGELALPGMRAMKAANRPAEAANTV